MNKTELVIESLPDLPTEKLTWVCYNKDMIKHTKELICSIKGVGYLKFIDVVPYNSRKHNLAKTTYMDPNLYDHIGNGSN
jgi:hypothetical protein